MGAIERGERSLTLDTLVRLVQYVDCHLLALQWLLVYDLLELLHDVGVTVLMVLFLSILMSVTSI